MKEKKEKKIEYDENGNEIIPNSFYYKIFAVCVLLACLFLVFVKAQHDKSYEQYVADMEHRQEMEEQANANATTLPEEAVTPVESTLVTNNSSDTQSPVVTTQQPATTTRRTIIITTSPTTTTQPIVTTQQPTQMTKPVVTTQKPSATTTQNTINDSSSLSEDNKNSLLESLGSMIDGNHGGVSDLGDGTGEIVGH